MEASKTPVLKYPDSFLSKKANKYDFSNPIMSPSDIEKKLIAVMVLNGGIGLAATQVGIDAQVFVMEVSGSSYLTVFNPVILETSDEVEMNPEGCLSFPGVKLYVERPSNIHVEFYDKDEKRHDYWVKGIDSRVFLHEYDHLQGVTFKDRVSPLKWNRVKHKLKV